MAMLFIPKFGAPKRNRPDERPLHKPKAPAYIIPGVNPLGIITVPTAARKICTSQLRKAAPREEIDETIQLPSVLHIQYCNDQVHHHMEDLRNLQARGQPCNSQLRPLHATSFREALEIYENNQVYYQDRLEMAELTVEQVKTELAGLERWFRSIPEPHENNEHQQYRLHHGHSIYCAIPLRKYVSLPAEK